MEHNRAYGDGVWQSFTTGQSWKSWSGVAFGRVCLKHIQPIKKALGIASTYTEVTAWRHFPATGKGAQIDLLIDRNDHVINLCEMKYSASEFTIDKSYADDLDNKKTAFQNHTKAKSPFTSPL